MAYNMPGLGLFSDIILCNAHNIPMEYLLMSYFFTNETTKAQRGWAICSKSHSSQGQNQALNPGLVSIKSLNF